MQLSNNGVKFIIQFEGISLEPYNDSRGFATIGIGHLVRHDPVISSDKSITQAQAYQIFQADSAYAQNAVNRLVKVSLNQNQFDALVSWTYNLGVGTLTNSKMLEVLNQGQYDQVGSHMVQYNQAAGVIIPGLTRRRQAEVILFNTPITI